MGQPAQLLALPGQKVPAFQQPSGKTSAGLKLFLDAKSYQEGLANLGGNKVGQRIEFAAAKATKVEPADYDLISVVVQDPLFQGKDLTLLADQVIFATGIGPQKSPTDAGIDVQGTPDNSLGFMQMEEGTDYLTHADRLGQVVVVYGGGATGAWVAAEVNEHLKKKPNAVWYWLAQQGGSGLTKSALPGDRNWMILLEQKFQKRMNIKKAVYKAKGADLPKLDWFSGMPERSMIELTLEEGGGKFTLYVDQLLYCLGGNPAPEGSISTILDDTLKRQLEPVEDINYMVSSNGKGVLAWATPKREVMIIGSAAFNFQDKASSKKPQAAPMEFLPPNAQVPDGIAVTVSTLEALNSYMPITSANGGKSLK